MASALEALKAVYKPKPENEDESGVGGDESVSEALSKEVFSTYVCRQVPDPSWPVTNFSKSAWTDGFPLDAEQLTGASLILERLQRLHPSGKTSAPSVHICVSHTLHQMQAHAPLPH